MSDKVISVLMLDYVIIYPLWQSLPICYDVIVPKLNSTCFSINLDNYWKSTNLEWSKSLLDLPTLTIKEIEQFIEESGKTGKTQKRADNFLYENFLDSVSCLHDTNHSYVRAICCASYTKSQYHQLSCALSKISAQILYAHCTCKPGQGAYLILVCSDNQFVQ